MNEDCNVFNLILMGDEAHFHIMGLVNIQNMHYCAPVNLRSARTTTAFKKFQYAA
jgi:hypothetical protein